jgi:hypothetical protein
MISVASEMSGESPGPYERNSQLAVQVCLNFYYLELGFVLMLIFSLL